VTLIIDRAWTLKVGYEARPAGQEVRALVRPTSDRGVLKVLSVELFEGDLMAPAALTRACEGVDAVVHAAAVVRAHGPWEAFLDGIDGTKNLLASMARTGVARLVHVSSIGVYGLGHHAEPLRETTALEAKPASWNHYGREKLLTERLVWDAFAERKVEPVVVRPSATLGPGDRARSRPSSRRCGRAR
jgi:dihydroflavonol-4-reductase